MKSSPVCRSRLVASNLAVPGQRLSGPDTINTSKEKFTVPSPGAACDLPVELWSQVAELLTPTDFLALTETCSKLRALHKDRSTMRRVVANSQIVPPVQSQVGEAACRLPRAPDPSFLRAEAHLIARLQRGPIVLDAHGDRTQMTLAASNLHASLYDADAKRCTVVPLYSELVPAMIFAAKDPEWFFFGAEAFEWVMQESAQGPLWLYDLREKKESRRCIVPFAKYESLNAIDVPGRLAFWVAYNSAQQVRLFEPDASGVFNATRSISSECTVGLRQASWLGDRIVWEDWLNDVVELIEVEPAGQWQSLLSVDITGCGCESITITNDGQVASVNPCVGRELVALGPSGSETSCSLDLTFDNGTAWAAPDGSSVVMPAGDAYDVHHLPSMDISHHANEDGLPPWMQAHLAWERRSPLIEAAELYDPKGERTVPVVVNTKLHGEISHFRNRFHFPEQTVVEGYQIAAGSIGKVVYIQFDRQRASVMYEMLFGVDREVDEEKTIYVSAASLLAQGFKPRFKDRPQP